MQNHASESTSKTTDIASDNVSVRNVWEKPTLEEFQIAAATQNAGIINLDADHALDLS